ncbi:MAG: argininosuccinate lyase [Thermoplasmata archaeon]|nr:argininosuccinate lyase [Thermoplasmata archaeon]MCI4359150.1 argininosuccinate lyase [Thermoplasmata archaeon]
MLRERFSRPLHRAALALSESTSEDAVLLGADLWGSLAHARMLGERRIIPKASARRIESGLRAIARQAGRGAFRLDPDLEDVHLNVERALTERIGSDGERLHTARSRNDQVATDLALFNREALAQAETLTLALVQALTTAARGPGGRRTVSGWTHLQPAQRLYWGGILGAHALRFVRDAERLGSVRRGIRYSPLGSGAIAGSSLPIDRHRTAQLLGFEGPTPSSLDAVSDRDASWESLFAIAMVQLHASQLAEELVIGAMPRSGRVRLSDGFVTTSSLMPHKRNPDIAELVRAESAGAIGRLTAGLSLIRSLPIGYQRDLQAGKPVLFEGFERLGLTLRALIPMIAQAQYLSRPEPDQPTASVELADALVRAGVPFRRAHARVARYLVDLESRHGDLSSVTEPELTRTFPELRASGFRLPGQEDEPERRTSYGGSSRREVDRLLTMVEGKGRRAEKEVERAARTWARCRARLGLSQALFRAAG